VIPLPIDGWIEAIRASLARAHAAVVTAQPGAGKTTRVPPALVDEGPVMLLQPRRVAARAIAQRIADERGWTPGREVGWQVRFERRFTTDTRLLVVTEGILTARLQSDPLLNSFRTVVIDEFHERSIHADLALALLKEALRARDDLRVVVMSATLDVTPIAAFLGHCPVFNVPGRSFPLEIEYAPGQPLESVAVDRARLEAGDVLCFLPGLAEIRRAVDVISARLPGPSYEVLPLHSTMDISLQQRILEGAARGVTRVIVATNIAETSVTVPGVRHVLDAGLQRVARYDSDRGIDSLTTERITQDAADQRAGRAGRTADGRVVRLWDARDRLRPHREPDLLRIDLAQTSLDVFAWGGDPRTLEWLERPRDDTLNAAIDLLTRLDAVHAGRITELGRQMQRLPLHPRLARMLVQVRGAWPMVQACALLAERQFVPPRTHATASDLLSAIDAWETMPKHLKQSAREIARLFAGGDGSDANSNRPQLDDTAFCRATLAGYPDRVARRRAPGSSRVKLATGGGATVGRDSGVVEGEFLVALDLHGARAGGTDGRRATPTEPIIRMAARIEPDWLTPNAQELRAWYDETADLVRAARIDKYDAIALRETTVAPDDDTAATRLTDAWLRRETPPKDRMLLRRLKFIGEPVEVASLVRVATHGRRSLRDVDLLDGLDLSTRRRLDREAPARLKVPSGRSVSLEYTEEGDVTAAVKLQEIFGLAETPVIGPQRVSVLLALLAPSGRPVQMTRDLKSFWERTYPEVRRELRGRYPKHPWPEDPWRAEPTAKTASRRR
jgi:ATP-dependent RNA helicase HrpB